MAVVHLVRAGNPATALTRFLASYRRHDAGVDHDLVLLLKGFARDDPRRAKSIEATAAADPSLLVVDVDDDGFDLTAYRRAANQLTHDRVCLLNSFSEVLADAWLAKLADGLRRRDPGAAGAFGSWESASSLATRRLGLPGRYRTALPDSAALNRSLLELEGATASPLRQRAIAARTLWRTVGRHPAFPNPHLRTNGLLIDRRGFLDLRIRALRSKRDAYLVESGRDSLTRQLQRAGGSVVTVDRDGTARHPFEWADADGFRQAAQADLLIADNQTDGYAAVSPPLRATLSRTTWGARARFS